MKLDTLTALVCVGIIGAGCGSSNLQERQAEVAETGREVMPFDLEATTHVFEKLETGGIQTVLADRDDPVQIALVRRHLAEEAERFAQGDFHDPAAIHGDEMPGLHGLMMGHDSLSITFTEVERGAQIRYESRRSALVGAIHQWFDAQLSDHGNHAQPHR